MDWKSIIDDYELLSKIREARSRQKNEIEIVLGDGETIRVRIDQIDPNGINNDPRGW